MSGVVVRVRGGREAVDSISPKKLERSSIQILEKFPKFFSFVEHCVDVHIDVMVSLMSAKMRA